jgi:hypothetical protein
MKVVGKCLDPTYFCSSCCNFYIGSEHGEKREACNERCESKINGVEIFRPRRNDGWNLKVGVYRKN